MDIKTSQRQAILEYLRHNKDITSFEAYDKLHITQFATRIKELEERGYEFKKEWDYKINKEDKKIKFKRYSLENDLEMANMQHIPRID